MIMRQSTEILMCTSIKKYLYEHFNYDKIKRDQIDISCDKAIKTLLKNESLIKKGEHWKEFICNQMELVFKQSYWNVLCPQIHKTYKVLCKYVHPENVFQAVSKEHILNNPFFSKNLKENKNDITFEGRLVGLEKRRWQDINYDPNNIIYLAYINFFTVYFTIGLFQNIWAEDAIKKSYEMLSSVMDNYNLKQNGLFGGDD
jgi:hypothetical protein